MIKENDMLPEVEFQYRVGDERPENGSCPIGGKFVTKTTEDLFANKRVVMFSLPGAFTPTCSTYQLPGFEENYDTFKANGIDEIYVVSVNDAFVMNAWAEDLGIKNVKVIPDGNCEFTTKMGMNVAKNNLGFGERSWRYSAYIENGIVINTFIERPFKDESVEDPFEVSDAETMLSYLKEKLKVKV